MKLIVAGANGYVGTEVIRQSLRRPDITSVIALSRKATSSPANPEPGADPSKLKSVIVKDYDQYPHEIKKELAGADACICPQIIFKLCGPDLECPVYCGSLQALTVPTRTVAITPSKSSSYSFEEVRRVCQTSTVVGLRAIHESGSQKPFRFLYMSGIAAERDQTKTPQFKPEYSLMRGETEHQVLAYAAEHKDEIEALVIKPGLITSNRPFRDWIMAPILGMTAGVPSIPLDVLSTIMLNQVTHGFHTDTLTNDDIARLGGDGAVVRDQRI